MKSILAWLKSESAAEKLICHSFVTIEMGDPKDGAAELFDGLIDLAPTGGKVAGILNKMKAAAIKDGLIAAPPVASQAAPAPVVPPVATPAPAAVPVPPAAAAAGS